MLWRFGIHFLNRTDARGVERLYLGGMRSLLGKDLAFFHDSFRLSTVQEMDRLVVIDRGTVLEQGTHAPLIAAGGTDAGLWARRSGGFLVDLDTPEEEVLAV